MSDEFKKKVILVTGGAGFIGSYLCEKYLNEGHRVICLDNLQTNYSTQNIDHLFKNKDFSFIKHDIIEPIRFNEKFDWIFNFACPAQCVNLQYDPVHTLKTSVHGVINMLELARRDGARIMQSSTSEIYGHNPKMPQVETDCGEVYTLGPRACYDEGKRVSETLMMDYYRQYGVDIKIIRIFNTYGPRMYVRDGRVMSNFIIPALAGKPLTIYGDGSYTRSFQFVDDLVAGIDKMMRKDGFVGPVNLGNPHEITIKELAETIIRQTGSKSTIIYREAVTDDPVKRKPDINLAKRELDWEPIVPLETGIDKTIAYYRSVQMPDKKILIFSTSYFPDMGPAETALSDLIAMMPETEFHIITAKMRRNLPATEQRGNTHIHRIGFGSRLDKYLLAVSGASKARAINKQHNFRFVWSVLASYGAIAAVLLKSTNKKLNFLLTFDRKEEEGRGWLKSKLIFPFYRWIFRNADSIYLSDIGLEKRAKFFNADSKISLMTDNEQELVNEVRYTFAHLLNKQEKKLERPR